MKTLRKYREEDFNEVSRLFCQTVRSVNARDYSPQQLKAWIKSSGELNDKREALLSQRTFVAEMDGVVVGFGSIDRQGLLDLLFVHKNYQGMGVATALCNELEKGFSVVKTYSSVTARRFFEKRGYVLVGEQEVERLGVKLKNFTMQKATAQLE